MKSVLELDPIEGTYLIRLPDYIVEDLEYWDEGDEVSLEVNTTRHGDLELRVSRI